MLGQERLDFLGAVGKAANLGGGVKVLLPSLARFGRLAYPLLGEVTNRDMRGCCARRISTRRLPIL